MSYQNETYKPQLEEAAEYQDFITDQLLKHGITLNQYASRKYQYERGESASGIEVKHDLKLCETGNLFIEVDERSSPEVEGFTPSGIYRDDCCWLYLIGDHNRAVLLSKSQMRYLLEHGGLEKFGVKGPLPNKTKTAHGYLVPYDWIVNTPYCLQQFVFNCNSSD